MRGPFHHLQVHGGAGFVNAFNVMDAVVDDLKQVVVVAADKVDLQVLVAGSLGQKAHLLHSGKQVGHFSDLVGWPN